MRLRRTVELAGIALSGADLGVREADRSYGLPREVAIVSSSELKSPQISNYDEGETPGNGPWRPAWPWLSDGGMVLTYEWPQVPERFSPKGGSCLDEFIDLVEVNETAFASAVLRFAKRWGPLGICEHRKPANHHRTRGRSPCWIAGVERYTEPLEAWRRYARQLRAVLSIAANLYRAKPGDGADWEAIRNGEPKGIAETDHEVWPGDVSGRVEGGKFCIAVALHRWLRYGQVELVPQLSKAGWFEIEATYVGLAGRLAVDLAAALRSPNGIYRCAGCGKPFTPEERKRARNRGKWCDSEECKAEQLRRNSRRYYERKKQRQPTKGARK